MYRFRRTLPVLVLAIAAASCASAGESGGGGQNATDASVRIVVENNSRSDLDVSVLSDNQELRVGRVQMGETGRLRAPAGALRTSPYSFSVRLIARDGTGTYTTPALNVRQGQNVYIDAGPTLTSSRFEVR